MEISDLYLVPVCERALIVSPLRRTAALVNRPAVAALRDAFASGPGSLVGHPALADLVASLLRTAPVPPQPPRGPLAPAFLGLVATRACNGACRYCGFGAAEAGAEAMDPRMAADLIEWMGRTVRELGRERLEVHLFGGEPLVAPDLVDLAVHKTRALAAGLGVRPHLEISTNGVVDSRRAHWVGRYFDAVVLSLDGPEEVHDAHRPLRGGGGSFTRAAATARILRDADSELCLRCGVSAQSVGRLEEIGLWLAREFQPNVIDFEALVPTPVSRAAGLLPPDPLEFAKRFLRLRRRIAPLGVEAVCAAAEAEAPRTTSCPVGRDAVIATPDGLLASCYLPKDHRDARGQPCEIGAYAGGKVTIDEARVEALRSLLERKPRCRSCFCRWTCCGGCHVDVTWPGCVPEYDDFCRQTRLVTAGLLLEGLGRGEDLDRLLGDREAAARLAGNRSDRIEDWGGAGW